MHFDGVFSELGYAMPSIAQQALLTVNKPNVMWNAGCYINSTFNSPPISYAKQAGRVTIDSKPWQCAKTEWRQPTTLEELTLSLHGALHMGSMYSPPFPGSDHSAYPFPGDQHQLYQRYKPLFMLLKGKRWLLRPHSITAVSSGVLTNIFQSHSGVIVVLGMAVPKTSATFTLSAEVVKLAGSCRPVVHHALGGKVNMTVVHALNANGSMVVQLWLGADGEAIMQIPLSC